MMWTDRPDQCKADIQTVSPKILWKHKLTWECVHTRATVDWGTEKKRDLRKWRTKFNDFPEVLCILAQQSWQLRAKKSYS